MNVFISPYWYGNNPESQNQQYKMRTHLPGRFLQHVAKIWNRSVALWSRHFITGFFRSWQNAVESLTFRRRVFAALKRNGLVCFSVGRQSASRLCICRQVEFGTKVWGLRTHGLESAANILKITLGLFAEYLHQQSCECLQIQSRIFKFSTPRCRKEHSPSIQAHS